MTKKFKLEIELENDAFQTSPETEVARILLVARNRIADSNASLAGTAGTLRDRSGNSVGFFMVETD